MRDAGGDSVDHFLVNWSEERYTDPVGLVGAWEGSKRFSRWQIRRMPNAISLDSLKNLIFHIDHVSLRGLELED